MSYEDLISWARKAQRYAYAPYSGYRVGAAVQSSGGSVVWGCNVENASYGLSMCAERAAVFAAVAGAAHEIVAVAVVTYDGGTPCGACRQVLAEFAPRDGLPMVVLLVDAAGNVRETTLADLLPDAFALSGPHPAAPSPGGPASRVGEGEEAGRRAGAEPQPPPWQAPPLPQRRERGPGGEGSPS